MLQLSNGLKLCKSGYYLLKGFMSSTLQFLHQQTTAPIYSRQTTSPI